MGLPIRFVTCDGGGRGYRLGLRSACTCAGGEERAVDRLGLRLRTCEGRGGGCDGCRLGLGLGRWGMDGAIAD